MPFMVCVKIYIYRPYARRYRPHVAYAASVGVYVTVVFEFDVEMAHKNAVLGFMSKLRVKGRESLIYIGTHHAGIEKQK